MSHKSTGRYTRRTDGGDNSDGALIVIETGSRKPTEQDVGGSSASEVAHDREDYHEGDKRSTAMEIEENADPHEEPSR